jgi:hypothetical protein
MSRLTVRWHRGKYHRAAMAEWLYQPHDPAPGGRKVGYFVRWHQLVASVMWGPRRQPDWLDKTIAWTLGWGSTIRIYAHPALRKALSRPADGDYGPVSEPPRFP